MSNEKYARELLTWIAKSKEFDLTRSDVEELLEDFRYYKNPNKEIDTAINELIFEAGDLVEFENFKGETKRGYITEEMDIRIPWGYENHHITENTRVIEKGAFLKVVKRKMK